MVDKSIRNLKGMDEGTLELSRWCYEQYYICPIYYYIL